MNAFTKCIAVAATLGLFVLPAWASERDYENRQPSEALVQSNDADVVIQPVQHVRHAHHYQDYRWPHHGRHFYRYHHGHPYHNGSYYDSPGWRYEPWYGHHHSYYYGPPRIGYYDGYGVGHGHVGVGPVHVWW